MPAVLTLRAYADSLSEEPGGSSYRALISQGARHCSHGCLVRRRQMPLGPDGKAFLTQIAPFIEADELVTEWPGTRTRTPERLITFRLEEESSSLLAHSVDGLFQWRQPGRPEDLSLLLADGAPWLTSIAHEEMAWIDGDEAMRLALQEAGLAVQADG